MRLLELHESKILMRDLIRALSEHFDMERVGGESRIYNVGDRLGVIFLLNNSLKALGLIWSKGSTRVESVAVWKKVDFDAAPDMIADIPGDAYLVDIIEPILHFIRQPKVGVNEDVETKLRNVTPDEFRQLAKQDLGIRAQKMTINDLKDIKDKFSVAIPSGIRHNPLFRADDKHWNLYDDLDPAEAVAKATGGRVGQGDSNDPDHRELAHLAALSKVKNMTAAGSVVIMGRKPNGEVFKIPGIEAIVGQLERMLASGARADIDPDSSVSSMESQYTALDQKVNLIVGGQSEFVKSLLITGAPSSGKTFRVMKVVQESGLKQGEDYVTKKGKISAKSLYRVLIQQLHGLTIFDDCDSVVKDPDGVNMLKGALDTDAVRTVDYDVQGLMNTDAMSFERRGEIVEAMSAILRNVPTEKDMQIIEALMGNKEAAKKPATKAAKKKTTDHFNDMLDDLIASDFKDEEEADDSAPVSIERMRLAEQFVMNNLPNKIDYYGRIIFISNMPEEEWDSAILTRAFHQNMDFPDGEMLDYIDSIKQHIKTPKLSDEDKGEVLDYIRELWIAGKITKRINFRLVQQAFDLFLMNDWRSLVAAIG